MFWGAGLGFSGSGQKDLGSRVEGSGGFGGGLGF